MLGILDLVESTSAWREVSGLSRRPELVRRSGAIAFTLIETAKLNSFGPQAWLTDALGRIADHKITKLDKLALALSSGLSVTGNWTANQVRATGRFLRSSASPSCLPATANGGQA